ncbi:MAG: MBL fold metallo-hydrolase [Promethearchaeati archaeon]
MKLEFNSEINRIYDVIQIKIDVPFAVNFVYVYLFKVNSDYILFDAGLNMGNWPKLFFKHLEELKISPKQITHCFISHNHLDHTGLIPKLRRKNSEIKILMHDITNETMRWETNQDNFNDLKKQTQEVVRDVTKFGFPEEKGEKLERYFLMWPQMKKYEIPDIILHDNDLINIGEGEFQVLWTPGHALGHICLFEKNNEYLFSGDHILSQITPHIGNFIVNPALQEKYKKYNFHNILNLYLNSLERIKKLNPQIIFPAHQEVIYDPIKRIEEIQIHHAQRLREISELITNNPMTPFDIAEKHFGELDDMNSFLALSEVLAHLFYLEYQNKIFREDKDHKILFSI